MAKDVVLRRGSKELADHWRGIVGEWSGSGLTQAEFCRRRGLSAPAFRWWKARFGGRKAGGPRSLTAVSKSRKRAVPSAMDGRVAFAEVGVMSAGPGDGVAFRSGPGAAPYEVVLAGGRVIRVGRDFEARTLSRLIAAVEASSC